ncbi:MAG TPA: conjugal transfer protein TraX [Erysipelotrichaceae bacterium]|nr:conjugal transfer protein TraX [Erysipelotrichaceae bacterium]
MKVKGSTLKIIALITMLIDHIGAFLIEPYLLNNGVFPFAFDISIIPKEFKTLYIIYIITRLIGRIAFPIYCFLIVEGFLHTSNLKKYAFNLLLFAFISEIPFNLANSNKLLYFDMQNVFFTLFLGLTCISLLDKYKGFFNTVIILSITSLPAYFLNVDYHHFGVLAIAVLYLFHKNKKHQILFGVLTFAWELTAPLAFIPIYFYNGERGKQNKYLYYSLYPLHLLILYLIRIIIFQQIIQ